jgi:hypothetical protein
MSSWRDVEGQMQSYMRAQPGTGGFWANVGIVRPWVKAAAAVAFVGMEILMWALAFQSPENHKLSLPLEIFLSTLAAAVMAALVLFYGYIYADAKRRGMRAGMWTLLAAFIPYLIGVILYFLLRDPLPAPCPKCGQFARGSFTFCPNCGCELLRVCRVCRKKLEPGWANCAYCGTPLAAMSNRPAPPVPPIPPVPPAPAAQP